MEKKTIPLIFFVVIISALGLKADPVEGSFDDKPYFSFFWELDEILVGHNPLVPRATPRPPPTSVVDYCLTVPVDQNYDLPDYHDCHAFWRCEDTAPIWHQCPLMDSENRMVFNPPQQRCDPPWQYPCQGSDSTTPETLTTATEMVTTTDAVVTSTFNSPPPTETPPTDPTDDGNSTPITTVNPEDCMSVETAPPTIGHICGHVSDGFNLPYYGDCNMYYQCRGSVVCLLSCGYNNGDQLVFNPVLGRCDDQWHYPCDIFEPVLPPTE